MGMWWGYQWLWFIYNIIYIYMYIYIYIIYICIYVYIYIYVYICIFYEYVMAILMWKMMINHQIEGHPIFQQTKIVTISISLAQEHECITSITIKLAGILQLVLVFILVILSLLYSLYSAGATISGLAVKICWFVQEGDTPNRGENDEPWDEPWDWMGFPNPLASL